MAHFPDHPPADSRLILLGDDDTVQHRDDLAHDAERHSCVIADVFGFTLGEPGSTDDLTQVDAIVAALGRAITGRRYVWVPFPGPDLFREEHWRRLSMVLQRHGLNLLVGRELTPCPVDNGINEIDFALRREVRAVDDLDNAALAAVGAESLGREIELALVGARARVSGAPPGLKRAPEGGAAVGPDAERAGPPTLPAPTAPWRQRQPELEHYVRWLVHGCGVTQAATARVLNSSGQRTPKGRRWQPATVSRLLNGRYDGGLAGRR